eukprot:5279869-Pyramimonas_sp.AAC.1
MFTWVLAVRAKHSHMIQCTAGEAHNQNTLTGMPTETNVNRQTFEEEPFQSTLRKAMPVPGSATALGCG